MRVMFALVVMFSIAFAAVTAHAGTDPLTKFDWALATTRTDGSALGSAITFTRIEKINCAAPNAVIATINVGAPAIHYEYTVPVAGPHCWWARTVLANGEVSGPTPTLTKTIILPLPNAPAGWSVD